MHKYKMNKVCLYFKKGSKMSNLFSGLEELGLNKAKDIKLYKDEEEKETKKKKKKK